MNLYYLQYFLAVARRESFSRAARDMHVTQPTVSNGVRELEDMLGVKLFNRGSRHVSLTMEGRALVDYAVRIQDLAEEAENRLASGDVLPGEGFAFGATDAAVTYLLTDILKRYVERYPELELSVHVSPSQYLVEELLANRSEFALITLPYTHPRIETMSIYHDSMPLVVGGGHPFAGRKSVALTEVAEQPLILFHEDSVSRRIVDERFTEVGVSPRVVMEMRSPEAMRNLVEAGVGISFLPSLTVQESIATGTLREVVVEGFEFSRDIGVAWRRGRYFSPALEVLLEDIFESYGEGEAWAERQSLERDRKL
ncbi:MAG: LysR family transcriptional regulator [Gemmatimonadetes bacterium]|nr:LysR family transcriptional regulator [Gemmatimonadota bacterium]MYB60479.1 LysR family transcriptional regulator [Gemmatimonadota bacterium]